MTGNRLGFWSSVAVAGVGVAYAFALAVGIARHGLHEPITDPVLLVMELLTIMSALPIVTLMAAVYDRAAPDRKIYGLTALAFATLCAGVTCVIHFVELTAARQMGSHGIVWPSRAYAAELLAWDLFLGIALVFAALVFSGIGPERAVRRGLLVGAILCLAGTAGPAAGNMGMQLIGVAGYAVILPIVSFMLARLFTRERA